MILEERISRLGTTIENYGAIYYMNSNLCLPNKRTGLLVKLCIGPLEES